MTISHFTDKTHQPTPAELQAALGLAAPLWERLLQCIAERDVEALLLLKKRPLKK